MKASSINAGKRFEDKFRKSAEQAGGYVIRIPDKVVFRGGRAIGEQTEADFLVAYSGDAHLVECKSANCLRLNFRNVKEHQEQALLRFDSCGKHLHGWLAVEFYDKKSYRASRRMFIMPITKWIHFKDSGRKSMPLVAFETYGLECPRQGAFYDINLDAMGMKQWR